MCIIVWIFGVFFYLLGINKCYWMFNGIISNSFFACSVNGLFLGKILLKDFCHNKVETFLYSTISLKKNLSLSLCLTDSPPERTGRRRSMPGSAPDKAPPIMEPTATAATPFRVTVSITYVFVICKSVIKRSLDSRCALHTVLRCILSLLLLLL